MNLDSIIKNFDYKYINEYIYFTIRWKRNINSPWTNLKEYQYLIKEYLENNYSFPFFITWYRKWLSINDNANIHKWKKYILNLDIKDFFSSITRKMIYNEFKNKVNEIDLFLDFITNKWVLPQWPPSSPIISNIIFQKNDKKIVEYLSSISSEITYSRYVDDLSIWFDDYTFKDKIFETIKTILNENGFILNNKKTKLFHFNKKLFVTWLILSENNVWIWYKKYRIARKIIYLYLNFSKWYFPYIKWMLLYIKWVDFKRYEQLRDLYIDNFWKTKKYKELFWISSNWLKINKNYYNKFNREFNYNKSLKDNNKIETITLKKDNEIEAITLKEDNEPELITVKNNNRFSHWKELLNSQYNDKYEYYKKYSETNDENRY